MKIMQNKLTVLICMVMLVICGIGMISSLIIASNKYEDDIVSLEKQNKILERKIKDQQRLIESQGRLLIEKDDECNCAWYEEYYYSHVGEDVFE